MGCTVFSIIICIIFNVILFLSEMWVLECFCVCCVRALHVFMAVRIRFRRFVRLGHHWTDFDETGELCILPERYNYLEKILWLAQEGLSSNQLKFQTLKIPISCPVWATVMKCFTHASPREKQVSHKDLDLANLTLPNTKDGRTQGRMQFWLTCSLPEHKKRKHFNS